MTASVVLDKSVKSLLSWKRTGEGKEEERETGKKDALTETCCAVTAESRGSEGLGAFFISSRCQMASPEGQYLNWHFKMTGRSRTNKDQEEEHSRQLV